MHETETLKKEVLEGEERIKQLWTRNFAQTLGYVHTHTDTHTHRHTHTHHTHTQHHTHTHTHTVLLSLSKPIILTQMNTHCTYVQGMYHSASFL